MEQYVPAAVVPRRWITDVGGKEQIRIGKQRWLADEFVIGCCDEKFGSFGQQASQGR